MPRKPPNYQTCRVCGQRHRQEEFSLHVPGTCWCCDNLPAPVDLTALAVWTQEKPE